MSIIYHITSRSASQEGLRTGEYRAESLLGEGFIHFSQFHQLLTVANKFYAGLDDLVILVVDTTRLKAELKYEEPVHPVAAKPADRSTPPANMLSSDHFFPHLYGPLNFDAVTKVVDLPKQIGGVFELPAQLDSEHPSGASTPHEKTGR